MIETLKEHLRGLKAEARLNRPEWYNRNDYPSGHWDGRESVLHREIAWIETVLVMEGEEV
jgi:hypothetical protein